MCGIAGFCNLEENPEENIKRMMKRMVHRGPDADGWWMSPERDVVLGHQRLSIVDLSENGAQPMHSHSGRYIIVYNGEIYNYRKIADKLIQEGKVREFRGSSDTEVLLEAIEAYGVKEGINLCKGMFAIALYDTKERVLTLIRDRAGEKPLYYGMVGDSFVFASDIASIAQLTAFHNPINTAVLETYFSYGYIPAPYTIYEGIHKLEAGNIATIKAPYLNNTQKSNSGKGGGSCVEIDSYWSMAEAAIKGQSQLFTGTKEEASRELERLITDAIKDQMVADVPVGAFLSAGIDSATIVALMQSVHSGKVRSFTIGMEEKGYNEATYAKEIAAHLGTNHTELYISQKDALEVIPKLAHIFGEPFADSSQIPTYLVSKMTREHVTVSLSGDGGDELFCGYTSYASVERIWNKMRNVPYIVRKPISELAMKSPLMKHPVLRVKSKLLGAKNPADLFIASHETESLSEKISLDKGNPNCIHSRYPFGAIKEPNHSLMLMDMLMYHPDDILVKVDRAAMAVSLETRVPMLDKDVMEFAWSLPIGYKREGATGKTVLREVLYRHVPKEMMERPKKGFSIPIDKWLKTPKLREWAEALIDKKLLQSQGILDEEVVWKIWDDFINGGEWRIQIWYILMFQEWMCSQYYVI